MISALPLLPLLALPAAAGETLFSDDFTAAPSPPWRWIRENPAGWTAGTKGLSILVEPGNMWGPENSGKNVLVRPAPNPEGGAVAISVTVTAKPVSQYEQTDLVWYYDDSHMVKIGQELVDGKLSIVMGREEKDRTRTIAILPLETDKVTLRLVAEPGGKLTGSYRPGAEGDWKEAGKCDVPAPEGGTAHVSIMCYQGGANPVRKALLEKFQIERLP